MTRDLAARLLPLVLIAALAGGTAGCKKDEPDYNRPLPPGANALRKITDKSQLPDLRRAFAGRDESMITAIDNSLRWFAKPSSAHYFPLQDIDYQQAYASVWAFRHILATSATSDDFIQRMDREFDTYISVGWDDKGGMLYTGYYTGIFPASRTQTGEFKYPLYRRPPSLKTDPDGNVTTPYATRAQIESGQVAELHGRELCWMRDKFEAYIVIVQGSARLTMTDGSTMYVGYAGNNGYEYTSIAKELVKDGKIDKYHVNLPSIKKYFAAHPEDVDRYLNRNERYVFFQEYNESNWPAGSLGVRVTERRSLATDKKVFPRGCVTLVQTTAPIPGATSGKQRFEQFMMDQDTGGAIRAAGRADIYFGIGEQAEEMAGAEFAEGKLYYFFLKPDRVGAWTSAMRNHMPPPG